MRAATAAVATVLTAATVVAPDPATRQQTTTPGVTTGETVQQVAYEKPRKRRRLGRALCPKPNGQLRMPVRNNRVSQRWSGPYPRHSGIDLAGPSGTPVVASAKGRVITVRRLTTSYGKYVEVKHRCGRTLYAHLRGIRIREGQYVLRGQQLGTRGNTGNSTGPHLHFEVVRGGRNINPALYLWRTS